MRQGKRLWIPAVAGLCAALAGSQAAARPADFDVLVVVLDACRPDRLGSYGYTRPTSPNLDALAAHPDAVLFRRHYAPAAWTKPSTASLFTGLRVPQHGLVGGHVEVGEEDGDARYRTQVLHPSLPTLAEALRKLGFATFGVVKSDHLVAELGFARGFQTYLGPAQTKSDQHRVERALALALDSATRYFGYLHLNACHHPFLKGERHPAIVEEYGFEYDEQARRREAGVDFRRAKTRFAIRRGEVVLTDQDVRFLNLIYDATVRWVDETLVKRIIDVLKVTRRFDRTLLIVTADHGEELYEHGGYAHGHTVWEEIIRVPLIVKFPKGRRPAKLGREVEGLTRGIDLFPSLVAFAGAPPPTGLPGTPIFGGRSAQFAYVQGSGEWALIQGADKLIEREDAEPSLFDLRVDPREQRDRAGAQPARVEALRSLGRPLRGEEQTAPSIDQELDAEARERLRSLGYLE